MDLKREEKRIKEIIRKMSIEEIEKALQECGNDIIKPTAEIFEDSLLGGLCDVSVVYKKSRTSYNITDKIKRYDKYDVGYTSNEQGVAA